MLGHESACLVQVTIPGEDTPRERAFAIRIKWAATVDIKAIVDFVRCGCAPGVGTSISRQLERFLVPWEAVSLEHSAEALRSISVTYDPYWSNSLLQNSSLSCHREETFSMPWLWCLSLLLDGQPCAGCMLWRRGLGQLSSYHACALTVCCGGATCDIT